MKNKSLSEWPRYALFWGAAAWVLMSLGAVVQCAVTPVATSISDRLPAVVLPVVEPPLIRHVKARGGF